MCIPDSHVCPLSTLCSLWKMIPTNKNERGCNSSSNYILTCGSSSQTASLMPEWDINQPKLGQTSKMSKSCPSALFHETISAIADIVNFSQALS